MNASVSLVVMLRRRWADYLITWRAFQHVDNRLGAWNRCHAPTLTLRLGGAASVFAGRRAARAQLGTAPGARLSSAAARPQGVASRNIGQPCVTGVAAAGGQPRSDRVPKAKGGGSIRMRPAMTGASRSRACLR
jgi:hypothetical protein